MEDRWAELPGIEASSDRSLARITGFTAPALDTWCCAISPTAIGKELSRHPEMGLCRWIKLSLLYAGMDATSGTRDGFA